MRSWIFVVVCLFAVTNAFAESAKQATPILPIEQFTKFDEFGTIKISPDGETLAITTGKYGRSTIALLDLKANKVNGAIHVPDGFEIDKFYWASRTRLLYTIAERASDMTQPTPTGEIYAIDRDTHNQKRIYGFRAGEKTTGTHIRTQEASYASAELISVLKNDDQNVLIAEHPWRAGVSAWQYDPDAKPIVFRLNIYTGEKQKLGSVPLGGATVLVDNDDQVRFAVGRNEDSKLAVSWKPTPQEEWRAFNVTGFRDESVVPRLFSKDNESVLFTGVDKGKSMAALYRLELKSGDVTKIYGFEDAEVSELALDFSGREVVGVFGYTDKPIHHWLNDDDRTVKLYNALYKAFSGQIVSITSASDDGRVAIVFVHSDVNPGDYYLFNTQTMKADYIKAARAWIDPNQMRSKEPFSLKARDGVELHGYLTRPNGNGPYPLVVMPHGGPHGVRDGWSFDSEAQLLANRGYAVLQVNFRGSGGYGMDFESAGYREWGGRMQDDITDATHWAVDQKIAEPERVCIFGASYGGYAALMGAVREPKLYRCAIGYAGIYDLELMFSSGDVSKLRSGRDYLSRVLGTDREQLHARSPAYNADKIEIPLLLIHGKDDWRADFDQAKHMKAALEKNHKQFEWLALSHEGHGAYDEETRRQVYVRVLAFLDRYLMAAH